MSQEKLEEARRKYGLPEGQQPDGELNGSEMVAYDRAKELSEQFADIQRRTLGDGVVRGTVTSIDTSKSNAKIAIEVDVPAEEEPERFYLTKPKAWDESYKFVRWTRSYGFDASDFAGMIEKGVEVEVRRDDGDYELVVPPEPKPGWVEAARELVREIEGTDAGERIEKVVFAAFAFLGGFFANMSFAIATLGGDVLGFSFASTLLVAIGMFFGMVVAAVTLDIFVGFD